MNTLLTMRTAFLASACLMAACASVPYDYAGMAPTSGMPPYAAAGPQSAPVTEDGACVPGPDADVRTVLPGILGATTCR